MLEVGCGTGVVAPRPRGDGRAAAARSSAWIPAARSSTPPARLSRTAPRGARIALRHADGAHLPFTADRFDAALAITVILHVADPLAVVREMARVTRPGGRVGLQDQDFGMVAVTHPDRALTDRIMRRASPPRVYAEPYSGRRLPRPAARRRSAATCAC